jgi:radical SAM superfamily enzyme YgiQ (UPF0313 family)
VEIDLKKEKILFDRKLGGPLKVLNCFPNSYEVGMASLGYQTIFKLYASDSRTHSSRYFTDFHENFPKEIHLITFSVSWELDFINIIRTLKELKIPLKSSDRDASHPLVLAGGPVLTANPEPWADFFDLIAIGDSESNTSKLIEATLDYLSKEEFREKRNLELFTKVPGIYVPNLFSSFEEAKVERQKSSNNDLAISSVITSESCWPDVGLLEVVRSCPEQCKFCLASFASLPFRFPKEEALILKAKELLKYTNKIGLLGASVSQNPDFIKLLKFFTELNPLPQVQIASLRAGTVSEEMTNLLKKLGVENLTIAIESGSERLREIINKKLPQFDIYNAAKAASNAGLKSLKLYGMVGLPMEEEEDLDLTIELLADLKKQNPKLKIIWGCSVFTPKFLTPFYKYGVDKNAEKKLKKFEKAFKGLGIEMRAESFKWAQVQALISRGDRSINQLLIDVHHSQNTGFGIYKKLLDKKTYEHFVFATW